MGKFEVYLTGHSVHQITYESIKFSGGEVHVKLEQGVVNPLSHSGYVIKCLIKSSDDIMELLMLNNALSNELISHKITIKEKLLYLRYIPYSRQDRVCDVGEANGIKVFSDIINSMNFDIVHLFDPHSDVSSALINNSRLDDVGTKFRTIINGINEKSDKVSIVIPDAGAIKRSHAYFGHKYDIFTQFSKIRNTKTGKITNTKTDSIKYDTDDFYVEDYVIVDDICDGGRTFEEISKVIQKRRSGFGVDYRIHLLVTNGIFSKGKDELNKHFSSIHALYDWTKE